MGQRLLELKDKCVHPRDNKPYIKSAMGGTDTSSEQLQVSGWSNVVACRGNCLAVLGADSDPYRTASRTSLCVSLKMLRTGRIT
jgi:hypothetical protein